MKKASLYMLIKKLAKVYFSDVNNKEVEYKKTIFYTLKNMGGVCIKFLQALCVTQKFMDGWASPKEFKVFNQVDREPLNIYDYLPKKEDFSYVEETPFACGSFAQLYKGELKTGEVVAIKVLRPSINSSLKKDLINLKKLVRVMNHFLPNNNMINYKAAFEEYSRNCLLETDYENEVSNMDYFNKLYEDHPYVTVPKAYKEYCTKYVITQDFIEGLTLSDVMLDLKSKEDLTSKVLDLTGSNVWTQITIAGGEALRTAMVSDYIFGDPHPGNIILLSNNKIAFVDFGLIASKPTSQEAFYLWTKSYYNILTGKADFGKLFETTCTCFCPDIINALRKCSTSANLIETISDTLNKKAKQISGSNESAGIAAQNGHLFTLFTNFIDSKNALNIKIDMRNFQLLKAMQAYICSVTTIDNIYGNNNFSKIMVGAMKYALDYCEKCGVPSDMITSTKYSAGESYEILLEMLSSLAASDEYLFQNISERMFL